MFTPATLGAPRRRENGRSSTAYGRFDESCHTDSVSIRHGFPGERLVVVPRAVVRDALDRPVTRRLTVTDAGWFPHAAGHERIRPQGTASSIVIVCVAGSGWAEVAGVPHRIGAGTALVVPGGVAHAYGASETSPWTIWWCHVVGSDVGDLVSASGATATKPTVGLRHPERAVALLDEIVTTLERDQSIARLIGASGAAWKLLTQIATDELTPAAGDPLQRAMGFLADRLDSSVPVSELAALVGVSPSHLGALFRRATGGGVLAHHSALRMARARQLLDGTAMTIAEVAADVGYADPLYFSRHFKRLHGVAPTQYRDLHKG
jgi:AraC family transcriptional regulator of arabinose operon